MNCPPALHRSLATRWIATLGLAAMAQWASLAAASPVVDSINGDATPPFLAFANNNIGWVYVPTSSLLLDGIRSTFRNVGSPTQQGPVAVRTVTLTVRENDAHGALLAQTSFTADGSGGALGGNFAPVLLVAGRKYFIAYDNVYNIGLNIPNWMPAQAPGTVNLEGWYTGPDFVNHYPKYIGTELQVFSAPILRFEGTRVSSLPATDCLLNWAEAHYPQLFAPAGGTSQVYLGYYYRYYAGTRNYVGISAADGHVYFIGADGALQDVGALGFWLGLAACPAG